MRKDVILTEGYNNNNNNNNDDDDIDDMDMDIDNHNHNHNHTVGTNMYIFPYCVVVCSVLT